MIAVYPGSFDPPTLGHADIIRRAARLSQRLIVAVLSNSEKKPLFSLDERARLLEIIADGLTNVEIVPFSGLLADFAREAKADTIIRGLRSAAECEYELQIAWVNRTQGGADMDTLFLPADPRCRFISSSVAREIAKYGGDLREMVHPQIIEELNRKYGQGGS
jgi:pantetheine-phosphate adenylyltransferase